MPLLEIERLNKDFDTKKVVNNITFTLKRGEILAILGESGSGKTSLLKLIAGLLQPTSGKLLLNNQPIIPPSEKLIAGHPDIKLVRQDYGLFPNISLRENIAYELRFYEEKYKNKRVNHLIKLGGLSRIQDKYPREVSGGEQQRTVILRSLAEQPKLLLLDEPFSHLDSRNKKRLKNEIITLIRNEGVSCIFVTHEANDAFGIADKIAVIQNGKFLQIDTPENVYQYPINQYVAEMTGEIAYVRQSNEAQLSPDSGFLRLRPSQIMVDETSETEVEIIKSIFHGAYYETEIEYQGIILSMHLNKKMSIGEKIKIKINLNN